MFTEEQVKDAGTPDECIDKLLESILSGEFGTDFMEDPFGMVLCALNVIALIVARLRDVEVPDNDEIVAGSGDDDFALKCRELCEARGKTMPAGGAIPWRVIFTIALPVLKDVLAEALEALLKKRGA